ncbi:hypothetical protein AWC05_09475 [Mycobacterium florentinum]|uniref:Uncharacterized protein n=1 Tax=Mycobacterium florentinum TaxID=292462 RepID=A0A1X1UL06_MYCFL|nr:hypothetical protein AWC05_09475 [Mycobacterium florentinum]BBX80718.1 hypothetical protein MFLOJ_45050 [Mycobacterium florentinum]
MPAEADGAVHITPAASVAAAPTVAINTLVFMLGFLFSGYIPEKLLIGIDLVQRYFRSAGV